MKNSSGCNNLGLLEQELNKITSAKKYFKLSCDMKYPDGCYNLGYLNYSQLENYQEANKYYKLACEYKNANGCYNLGHLNYNQLKNYKVARKYYQLACDMKDFLTKDVYPPGRMNAEFTSIGLRDRFKSF